MEDYKTRRERERATWQFRAVEATRGNQSQLGAILLSVLGKQRNTRPQFPGKATISSDGCVFCNFITRAGELKLGAFVGDVEDLTKNFRGLADHLKLNDADRAAMFLAVRNWIATDYRANKRLL